jgi:hypothetical protein
MEIDLVYLWVDGSDPAWLSRKNAFLGIVDSDNDTNCKGRTVSNDELKYSLRSVEKHLPWIRKIFIVTDQQIPAWLNISNSKIQIIDHTNILPKESLPCYNSVVLEYFLYRIPSLSEHFLYANDDMFFNANLLPSFFFGKDGYPVVRLRRKLFGKWRYVWKQLRGQKLSTFRQTILLAAQLVKEKYGKYYSGVPHHNIDAYRKSDYQNAIEVVFKDEIIATQQHHLRTINDIQRAAFLYYALAIGHGHLKYVNYFESKRIGVDKKDYEYYFRKYKPSLFCFNDGQSVTDADRQRMKTFLDRYFPTKSSFEK